MPLGQNSKKNVMGRASERLGALRFLPLSLAAFTLMLIVVACGGEMNQLPPAPECGLAVEQTSVSPGERIPISAAASVPLEALTLKYLAPIESVEVEAGHMLMFDERSQTHHLVAPFHPMNLVQGGPVSILLTAGSTTCSFDLNILPLPDPHGPGVAGASLAQAQAMQQDLNAVLDLFDLDAEALRGDLTGLPEVLLPWAVAQFLLDHPENPYSLVAMLTAGEVTVDGETFVFDMGLLDSLMANAGMSAPALRTNNFGLPCRLTTNPFTPVSIPNPSVLESCLLVHRSAAHSGGYWELASALATIAGVAATLAPEPAFSKGIAAVMLPVNVSLAVSQAHYKGLATLLPRGVKIDFAVSAEQVDVNGEGTWHSVTLTPIGSQTFSVDLVVTELVLNAVSALGPEQRTFLRRILNWLIEEIAKGVAGRLGFWEIGPYSWPAIPIPDDEVTVWTLASVNGNAISISDVRNRRYRGQRAGEARLDLFPNGRLLQASSINGVPGRRTIRVAERFMEVELVHYETYKLWAIYFGEQYPVSREREFTIHAVVKVPPNHGIPNFNPNINRGEAETEVRLGVFGLTCSESATGGVTYPVSYSYELVSSDGKLTVHFDTKTSDLHLLLEQTFIVEQNYTCDYTGASGTPMTTRIHLVPMSVQEFVTVAKKDWTSIEDGVHRITLQHKRDHMSGSGRHLGIATRTIIMRDYRSD